MTAESAAAPSFQTKQQGIHATMQLRDGQFVVLKGSQARVEIVASLQGSGYATLREELIRSGRLGAGVSADSLAFLEDTTFTSPSAAAAVALGRTANGNIEWVSVVNPQQTYGAWLEHNRAHLPPSVTAQLLEPAVTTWQPFFKALAHKLLEFEHRQPDLVEIVRAAGVSVNDDEGQPLTAIDPFTVFGLINKHTKLETVQGILRHLKSALRLETDVPADLLGVGSPRG